MKGRAWKNAEKRMSMQELRHVFARNCFVAGGFRQSAKAIDTDCSKMESKNSCYCVDRLLNEDGGAEVALLRKAGYFMKHKKHTRH